MKKVLFVFLFLPLLAGAQIITTCGGNGTFGYSGDGGPATNATFNNPVDVATDLFGNIYITDNNVIRKINSGGIITTIAGNGINGYSGDGGPATAAELYGPQSIVADRFGNLFFSDLDNARIRKISTAGIITTVAGNGIQGYAGDGGPATNAHLNFPWGIAVDTGGNIYVAEYENNVVRKIDNTGIISTVAGNGFGAGTGTVGGFSGDNGPATAAELFHPIAVALDSSRNLYIADVQNYRIRKVSISGIITTFAGNGSGGYSGDNGYATVAQIEDPYDIAIDGNNNVYIADYLSNVIRKINTNGIITTYAGNGTGSYGGDNGPANLAMLYGPEGIGFDTTNTLYIADNANGRIRKVIPPPVSIRTLTNQPMDVVIYPNPATSGISISATRKINSVIISDVIGQIMHDKIYDAAQVMTDVSELPKGVYLIRINNEVVKKFVKE